MVLFDDNGSHGKSDNSDDVLSAEFNERYGRPGLTKAMSYKVVGRLSRWEGGNATVYQGAKQQLGRENKCVRDSTTHSVSLWKCVKHFFKPTYDLTEVTIEDIERVKLMHDRFLGDAQFSFNYFTLLMIASVIAGVGLGSNSTASIIASMLVSPLMGPVTAISYGISIGDGRMVQMALVTEAVSLGVCILTGLIIAGFMLPFDISDNWPVSEMTSRGTWTNFFCGIPIAFFSGLGVAVGLLDSQTNSLVGVAISASLLPPAVNAGILMVIHWSPRYDIDTYSNEAMISLGLTVMNIGVIIIASCFMFRLKETLPIEKSIFWDDLGVARKIYHNAAILPKIQEVPDDQEIQKRVTRFFPRASAVLSGSVAMPSYDEIDSINSPNNSEKNKVPWNHDPDFTDNTPEWSGYKGGTAGVAPDGVPFIANSLKNADLTPIEEMK